MAQFCYNLVSCEPEVYPHLLRVYSPLLASFANQYISINGDSTKRYLVKPIYNVMLPNPDSIAFLCSLNILSRTYVIDWFEVDGVSIISGPQTLNITAFEMVDASVSNPFPVPMPYCMGANSVANVPNWINSLLAAANMPISAIPKHTTTNTEMAISIPMGSYMRIRINIPAPQNGSGTYVYEIFPNGSSTVTYNNVFSMPYGIGQSDLCFNDVFKPVEITSITPEFGCSDIPSVYTATSCNTSQVFDIEWNGENPLDESQIYKFEEINGCFTVSRKDRRDGVNYLPVNVSRWFGDCDTCLCPEPEPPTPPIPAVFDMRRRLVSPNYTLPYATVEEIVNSYCPYSEYAYDAMNEQKYGIKICCKVNYMNAWVDKELMDLKKIEDKGACQVNRCCEPDCVIATIIEDCESPLAPMGIII